MPRIEMLQAGLIWAEKELNGWAGDIEGEGEIGGSSEGVAHRLRDIAQSIRTTLEFADAVAEVEASGPKRPERTVFVSPSGTIVSCSWTKRGPHTPGERGPSQGGNAQEGGSI